MKKPYTNESDLWSIGVIMYQMYFNAVPFFGYNEKLILNDILKKKGIPSKMPKEKDFSDLLLKIFVIDPKKRITWDEYFNHLKIMIKKQKILKKIIIIIIVIMLINLTIHVIKIQKNLILVMKMKIIHVLYAKIKKMVKNYL